jgi:hypothetical protein
VSFMPIPQVSMVGAILDEGARRRSLRSNQSWGF